MISVAIGRSMLKSYESIADREVRIERANRVEKPVAKPVMSRIRELLSGSK